MKRGEAWKKYKNLVNSKKQKLKLKYPKGSTQQYMDLIAEFDEEEDLIGGALRPKSNTDFKHIKRWSYRKFLEQKTHVPI